MEPECCGVVPADPVGLVISGTLEMEFGDSITVFMPPVIAAFVLLRGTSPEQPVAF